MVDNERRTIRGLKQQQADMMQQRTEIEVLLRQCLDDVKGEIMRHRLEHESTKDSAMPRNGMPITAMSAAELTAQDRERVLELLLSQQRVVQLLYSKTFPQQLAGSPPSVHAGDDAGQAKSGGKDDDFSW